MVCLEKRQKSIIEVYFQVFIYQKQNDWVKLILLTKLTYNNVKNLSTHNAIFELNCGYHPHLFF